MGCAVLAAGARGSEPPEVDKVGMEVDKVGQEADKLGLATSLPNASTLVTK